jgi:hypothetical protein
VSSILPYDPGVLPTRPAPSIGEKIVLELQGLPPRKDGNRSIRNRSHPRYNAFVALRSTATSVMAGRAWVFGPVRFYLVVRCPRSLNYYEMALYQGGVMDTLDGSSGHTFTFLPIIFEDDCQITEGTGRWVESSVESYTAVFTILPGTLADAPRFSVYPADDGDKPKSPGGAIFDGLLPPAVVA